MVLLAMGVEEISLEIEPTNVKPALKVFPEIPDLKIVCQPSGKVDLLIGLNYLEVQPRDVARVGGLSLWESRFGSGYLLGGTHPDIWLGSRGEALVLGALHMSRSTSLATYKVSHSTQSSKDKTREVDNVGIPGYGDEDVFEEPGEAEQEDQEGPVNHVSPQGVPEPNSLSTAELDSVGLEVPEKQDAEVPKRKGDELDGVDSWPGSRQEER